MLVACTSVGITYFLCVGGGGGGGGVEHNYSLCLASMYTGAYKKISEIPNYALRIDHGRFVLASQILGGRWRYMHLCVTSV